MKRLLILCIPILLLSNAFGQTVWPDYHDGQAFVKWTPGTAQGIPNWHKGEDPKIFSEFPEILPLLSRYDIQSIEKPFRTQHPNLQSIREIRFGNASMIREFLADFEALAGVEYAEAVPIMRLHYTPNDVSWLQWHLSKIEANAAWDFTKGSSSVLVAIVDDGIRSTHEDLAPNLYVNPNEIPGNGIDDDNNGFTDDVSGWDAADNDNNPDSPTTGGFGHGTHVAGIAAAATDNGTGIASIGFNVSIVPCKTKLDANTSNNLDNTYGGLDYAITIGADVVNMSFGGQYSLTFAALVNVAYDSNMVLVASAGNNNQQVSSYPAGYNHVISVGSTDLSDNKSSFSNYHQTIDVMAPGSNIYSCTIGSDQSYGFMSGTSMSGPVVAGLCALMRSIAPDLSPDDLESCLKASCDNIDAQNPTYVGLMGAGRINARKALDCLVNPVGTAEVSTWECNVWPNPAQDQVQIAISSSGTGMAEITLIDMMGKSMILPIAFQMNGGKNEFTLPLNGIPVGLYLIKVKSIEGEWVQMILVK